MSLNSDNVSYEVLVIIFVIIFSEDSDFEDSEKFNKDEDK